MRIVLKTTDKKKSKKMFKILCYIKTDGKAERTHKRDELCDQSTLTSVDREPGSPKWVKREDTNQIPANIKYTLLIAIKVLALEISNRLEERKNLFFSYLQNNQTKEWKSKKE